MGQRLSEDCDPDKEIDVAELQEWYKKFVVECPSGTLFMHEFKGFFGVTENKEAADYIENMFRAFDKNGVSTTFCCLKLHMLCKVTWLTLHTLPVSIQSQIV